MADEGMSMGEYEEAYAAEPTPGMSRADLLVELKALEEEQLGPQDFRAMIKALIRRAEGEEG